MSVATEPTTTVTIRVPHSLRDQLDALAQAMGRNRQFLGLEALRRYVAVESGRWAGFSKVCVPPTRVTS